MNKKEMKLAHTKSDIDVICKMQQKFSKLYNADGKGVLDITSDGVQMYDVFHYAEILDVPWVIEHRGKAYGGNPYEVSFVYKNISFFAIYTKKEILEFVDADELPNL